MNCLCTTCKSYLDRSQVVWYHGVGSDFICKNCKRIANQKTTTERKWVSFLNKARIKAEKKYKRHVSSATKEEDKEFVTYSIYNPKTNRVKFGKSFRFQNRYLDLCRASGENLEILGVIYSDTELESFAKETAIKRLFKKNNFEVNSIFGIQKTEWFEYTQEIKDFINEKFEEYIFEIPLEYEM